MIGPVIFLSTCKGLGFLPGHAVDSVISSGTNMLKDAVRSRIEKGKKVQISNDFVRLLVPQDSFGTTRKVSIFPFVIP